MAYRCRQKYYRKLISEFEGSNAQFLYRESDEQQMLQRRTQLLEIFERTGELFSKLWSQKTCIGIFTLQDLLKCPFKIASEVLEAHAAHKVEAGDKSMDGKPVQMVVEPAIVAWGNERGESYNAYKIWARAVVWMSSGTITGGTVQA